MTDKKSTSYQLGDVDVTKITVTPSGGKPFNILPQIMELSLYEDVLTPYRVLEISVIDAIGLLRTLPIIGEEEVELEFQVPGREKHNAKFKIVEVVVGSASDNQTKLAYKLVCMSPEVFTDSVKNVEKGYKKTIDEIVKSILTDELKTTKKLFYEQSKGVQEIVFTRKSPFQAIDFLRKRAISQKYTSSLYFFFENKYGYNFNTLEGMMDINKKSIGDKIYTRHVILNDENQNPQGFRQILSYNVGRQFNMVSSMSLGALNAVHQTFDILKKEFKQKKYTISDFPEFKNAEESGAVSPFGQKTISEYGKEVANYYYNISNSAMPDTYLNDNLVKKIAFASIQLNGSIDIHAYGDSNMTIGDVFTLKIPKTDGKTKQTVQPEPLQTGNYIITKMNHNIQFSSGRPKYMITFTGIRGIYSQ